MRRSRGDVLRLMVALVLIGSAQPGLSAGVPSAFAGAVGVHTAVAVSPSSRGIHPASRFAASLTPKQRAAAQRLAVTARNLHRTVDEFVRTGSWIYEINLLSNRVELMLAIRNARSLGLGELARRYQRILDLEMKRAEERRSFGALLSRAQDYGQHAAQKAHEDNPSLPQAVLGNIAVNAANWYGNDALLKITLRAAKQTKNPRVYEITLKKGEDLDRRAYALYRSLSVGARKTDLRYGGRDGLYQLPDAKGGFNGGLIGFRRAAETSEGKSPAIDIKTADGKAIKIHVRH
jgi:hypothetical protein